MRRRRSRGALGACAWWVAVATTIAPGLARAEGPPPSGAPSLVLVNAALEYTRGPGVSQCPGEDRLREEVARRLGYDPFAPGAGGRAMGTMRTVIARADRGLTATTEYVDAAGALRWTKAYTVKGSSARDCEVVVSGVAIQIAAELMVFEAAPKATTTTVPPPAPPAPLVTKAPAPPPECAHAPEPASSAASAYSRRPWLEIGAGVSAVFGMAAIPVTSGIGHIGIRVYPFDDRGPWFSFAVEFRGDVLASANAGGGVLLQQSMLGGSGLVCIHRDPFARGAITGSLLGCVIGTAGSVSGGYALPELGPGPTLNLPYVGAGLRPGIEARFSNLGALRLQADAMAAIKPARFLLGPIETATSRFSLGLGVAGMILF